MAKWIVVGSAKNFEIARDRGFDADARCFQRHVNPSIMVHGHPSRCLELPAQTPFDTISLRDDRQNAYGLGRGPLHHLNPRSEG